MFGYVRPPLQTLSETEANRFRSVYCGLCHVLGCRYGAAARLILNYDFTYLAILLSSGEEPETEQRRCAVHPVKSREFVSENDALNLAADESVILTYWQLRDGVADLDWLHGLKYRSLSAILEPAYQKASALRPEFDQAVRRQLQLLHELEAQHCNSIDAAADAFAVLLESAAAEVGEPVRRRVLQQILYHLGRWIYLIDAADDLKKDIESGNYNPILLRFDLRDGAWTPEARREFTATLDHSIHLITTAFELWDFGVWKALLADTFYTSLFQVGKAVLDGTFQKQVSGKLRKRTKEFS